MIQSYSDIDAYKGSYSLALRVHRLALTLPEYERYGLTSQIRRATVSIPSNIAEGYGRKDSAAEFKHFLRISLGSCNEVRVLLDMLKDLEYIESSVYEELIREYDVVGRQLNRLIQAWRTF